MSLIQVFYISRCRAGITATDVHRIVGSSQILNRRRRVTGLLAYSGQHFVQVVEGSALDVDGLLRSISSDPRHCEMTVLRRAEGVPRRFGNWSMHLVDSVGRADEIERLFAADRGDDEAAGRLLEAIAADARWHQGGDLTG